MLPLPNLRPGGRLRFDISQIKFTDPTDRFHTFILNFYAMKKLVLSGSFLIAAMLFLFTGSLQAQVANISGKWNMKVETSAGSGTPVFVLKQSGDLITGTYTGQLGEAEVKGTLKDKEIKLEFKAGEIPVVYTGTVDGNTMKGKAVFGDMGEGTFTGSKELK